MQTLNNGWPVIFLVTSCHLTWPGYSKCTRPSNKAVNVGYRIFFPSRSMFQINEDRIGDNKNASLPLSLTRMVKMVVCELEGEGWELI
jgi:hypothetical protein